MKIIKSLIVNVIVSWTLLYLFSWMNGISETTIGIKITLIPSIWESIIATICTFLILGLIFRIFNSPIKWILKTLSCPVNFFTLWLASILINVLIFYIFAYIVNNYLDLGVTVELWNILQTLILSFIMSICTTILTKILK